MALVDRAKGAGADWMAAGPPKLKHINPRVAEKKREVAGAVEH
jgi:hypothetical protein